MKRFSCFGLEFGGRAKDQRHRNRSYGLNYNDYGELEEFFTLLENFEFVCIFLRPVARSCWPQSMKFLGQQLESDNLVFRKLHYSIALQSFEHSLFRNTQVRDFALQV